MSIDGGDELDVPVARRERTRFRRGDPWFEDGNMILLAQDGTAFKIHRGVLARRSQVFESMLQLPQPSVDRATNETDDDESRLHERIKRVERRLLVEVVERLGRGGCTVDGRKVSFR